MAESQEMPPHWASDAIDNVVQTRDAGQIARALGDAIAKNPKVRSAIDAALATEPPGGKGPGTTHRIRQAVANAIGEYA
jgi:hypothetical protein